jgi:hypothetical protein
MIFDETMKFAGIALQALRRTIHPYELDEVGVAPAVEEAIRIPHEGDSTAHPSGEVFPGRSEDD